jgi:hypothetical protein
MVAAAACAATAVAAAVPAARSAPFGTLSDTRSPSGCVAQANISAGLENHAPEDDGCASGRALRQVHHVALSPDERFLYAAAGTLRQPPEDDGALSIFSRDAHSGGIRQLPGARGCVKRPDSPFGSEGCGVARNMHGTRSVIVHPGGRTLYSMGRSGIAIFRRDIKTGALRQLPGAAGCVNATRAEGCSAHAAAISVEDIAFGHGGRIAYAVSDSRGAVITFRIDRRTGRLRPVPGRKGCLSANRVPGCRPARGLRSARSITLSRDGRHAYVAAIDEGVGVFSRASDGTLTQLPGPRGCLSYRAVEPTCGSARGMLGPHRLTLSRDGRDAYLAGKRASEGGSALVVFRRNPRTGRLRQPPGVAGCFTEHSDITGPIDGCTRGRVIRGAHQALLDHEERTLIVSSDRSEGGLALFRRDTRTGRIEQLPGGRGCLSPIEWQGCGLARRSGGIHFSVISRDGRFVYSAGENSYAVVVYRRQR